MKLLTKELEKSFEKAAKSGNPDRLVIAKFFDPCGSYTFWATEWDPESRLFYGFVTGLDFDEWGYTALAEIESYRGPFGIGIERDLYFKPAPINEALKSYYGENAPKAA